MAIRFSLAHLTALGFSPPDLTRVAARAGYDFVSLRTIYMGLPNEPNYDLASNKELLRETKAALSETGLGLHDIELARINEETDPRKYLPAFEVAAELGCKEVISSVWTPKRELALERFRATCDLARPLGLRVNLEFMVFSEVKTLADAIGFLRAAGARNAGLLVDTLHFHCSRGELQELEAVPRELLGFAHLCDGPAKIPSTTEGIIYVARAARRYPGEGGIDIAGIVNSMPDLVCSIELPNYIKVEIFGREGHVKRCLESTKAYLAAHPR
jgi:sugar phosphate isomerase/epimerase